MNEIVKKNVNRIIEFDDDDNGFFPKYVRVCGEIIVEKLPKDR